MKKIWLFTLIFCICHQSPADQVEEPFLTNNGTNASISLNYLTKEFQNNKKVEVLKESQSEVYETPKTQETLIPHSLISNDALSSGLSETGQVPVVVTILDSGSSDLSQHASHVLKHDLEVVKNKTRLLQKLAFISQNSNESSDSEQSLDNVLSATTLPNLSAAQKQAVVPPPPLQSQSQNQSSAKNESAVVPQSPSAEDIPSFREWTQKQLAEAEKKKGENLTVPVSVSNNVKMRSKNYASPDCGAKIVGSNAEAKSPNSVLSPSRDEYILSPCTSKIWFAVELCESIQAKKIELANFELFSSSPKEFTVSVADRWPTKDWTVVGILTAKDERTVQSFTLQPSLFAKYMKLEFHSHYGAEHFCPVSLLRVFGTSELDVLDSDPHEVSNDLDEDDELEDSEDAEAGNNIFGSARDAVISIVKKAAEALTPQTKNATREGGELAEGGLDEAVAGGKSGGEHSGRGLTDLMCITPSHIIVCDNCTDDLYSLVFNILSCHHKKMEELCQSLFINQIFRQSHICREFGLNFDLSSSPILNVPKMNARRTTELSKFNTQVNYVSRLLRREIVASVCNYVAVAEHKVVLNITETQAATGTGSDADLPLANEFIAEDARTVSKLNDVIRNLPKANEDVRETDPLSSHETPKFCTVVQSSVIAFPRTTAHLAVDGSDHGATRMNSLSSKILSTQQEFYTNSAMLSSQIKPTKTLDNLSAEELVQVMQSAEENVKQRGVVVGATTNMPSEFGTASPSSAGMAFEGSGSFGDGKVSSQKEDAGEGGSLADVKNVISNPSQTANTEDRTERDVSPDLPSVLSSPSQVPEEEASQNVESLEKLFSELEAAEQQQQQPTSASASPPQQLKESVLIRLANRIKSLERNMSLSGQYLDELSRRYKRQIEDMTRALNEALEERKRGEMREMKLSHELGVLAQQLATLTVSVDAMLSERDSWMYKVSTVGQHTIIIFLELIIFCAVLFVCRLVPQVEISQRKISIGWHRRTPDSNDSAGSSSAVPQRRVSDTVLSESGEPKKRRPSEEALRSSGTTHSDLIIVDSQPIDSSSNLTTRTSKAEKRRKRKKKEVKLQLSSSFNSLPGQSDHPSGGIKVSTYDGDDKPGVAGTERAQQPRPRLKRTSSSDHISWYDQVNENLQIRNSFEPLYLHAPSPDQSPRDSSIFNTAMSIRHKRSLNLSQATPFVQLVLPEDGQSSTMASERVVPVAVLPSLVKPVARLTETSDSGASNGSSTLVGASLTSRNEATGGTPKKSSGFKKIVKKFF